MAPITMTIDVRHIRQTNGYNDVRGYYKPVVELDLKANTNDQHYLDSWTHSVYLALPNEDIKLGSWRYETVKHISG